SITFFGVVKGAFLQGGAAKKCVLIVVNLWWIGGKSWCVDARFSAVKNMPSFSTFFFTRDAQDLGSSPTERVCGVEGRIWTSDTGAAALVCSDLCSCCCIATWAAGGGASMG